MTDKLDRTRVDKTALLRVLMEIEQVSILRVNHMIAAIRKAPGAFSEEELADYKRQLLRDRAAVIRERERLWGVKDD